MVMGCESVCFEIGGKLLVLCENDGVCLLVGGGISLPERQSEGLGQVTFSRREESELL